MDYKYKEKPLSLTYEGCMSGKQSKPLNVLKPYIVIIEEDKWLAFRYVTYINNVVTNSHVIVYDSASIGLDKLTIIRFDIIFINIGFYAKDWKETIEKIRKISQYARYSHIPVVGITGGSDRELSDEFRQVGIDGILGTAWTENFARIFRKFGILK